MLISIACGTLVRSNAAFSRGMDVRKLLIAFAMAASLGAAPSVHAVDIPIVNPSFEADFAPNGGFPVLNPTGWSRIDPGNIVNQNNNAVGVLNPAGTTFFVDPVPHGNNVALIYLEQRAGTTNPGDMVGLQQTLAGSTLQINTRYTLTAAVGNIASGSGLGAFAGFGFADLSGFPGYRVELLADGQVVAFDQDSVSIGEGRFGLSEVKLTVGNVHPNAGQTLGIRLINRNFSGNLVERAREVDFDNVALVATAVPEPSAYLLLLAGFGLILGARSSRRRAG